jgi:hypothetical protein
VSGPSAGPSLPQSDTPSRPSRRLLLLAASLAILWCAILIGMTWLTADPVTLNREQVLRADFVVTGRVESNPVAGEVVVSREWKKNGLTGTIHVENLDDARARRGVTYLLPLSHSSTGFRVIEARTGNGVPLIYPDTAVAIEQLEKILADRAATN